MLCAPITPFSFFGALVSNFRKISEKIQQQQKMSRTAFCQMMSPPHRHRTKTFVRDPPSSQSSLIRQWKDCETFHGMVVLINNNFPITKGGMGIFAKFHNPFFCSTSLVTMKRICRQKCYSNCILIVKEKILILFSEDQWFTQFYQKRSLKQAWTSRLLLGVSAERL